MGEVYRATDTNLKRQVAIKVLPSTLATDPERLARFQREAEVLAALNHPNIAHIHGLEKSKGTLALVMELVEGPTLADRIAHGAIPVADALPIAKQIAEALEAAHEQGIIHRDLKPANIKVRADGTVKVLDFGLAKAMDPAGVSSANAMNSPTISVYATHAGTILGTAAYMSPEQAAGNAVDRRSDLWAFGVVLLEMLTGRQVFKGETVSHVLAAVLKDEPEWATLPANTPPVDSQVAAAVSREGSKTPARLSRRCAPRHRRRSGRFFGRRESCEPDEHSGARTSTASGEGHRGGRPCRRRCLDGSRALRVDPLDRRAVGATAGSAAALRATAGADGRSPAIVRDFA